MVTAGTSSSPIFLAARTRPQPATTRRSASTTTGKTMPNWGLAPERLQRADVSKLGIEVAGYGKAIPTERIAALHQF
jgi:hypothetical protein